MPQVIEDDRKPSRITMGQGPRPGDRIGRYVIRSKLGRGGMGVVYGAYDPILGRRVALKLVRHRDRLDGVDIQVDERLRREAQALARLAHPNVVSLYDVGSCAHGDYLALELVPGINLDRWLRKQLRSWQEIIDVFLPAGRGLAAAHRASLIHRDFKPTNVIVGPQGHVTVVDFGLARSAELNTTLSDPDSKDSGPAAAPTTRSRDSEEIHAMLSTRLTGDNIIVGTHGYMAPEQLLGLLVGPRADQFSFCAALFEALYGVRPFRGANAVQVARAFSRGERVEPDNPKGAPERVHEILARGLSIDAEDRFPSMEALLDALRRCRTGWRMPLPWIGALVATAALSGLTGALVHHMVQQPEPAPAATSTCESAEAPARVEHDAVVPKSLHEP